MRTLPIAGAFLIAGTVARPLPAAPPAPSPTAPTAPAVPATAEVPEALVRSLYKLHNKGYGPIFDKKGKKFIDYYFDARLAALIWKNILGPASGEVGNLDFDPLFNAQDLGLSELRIGTAQPQKSPASVLVPVTFKNYGKQYRILFQLHRVGRVWKIQDLDYGGGQRLVTILSEPF